MDNQYYRNEAMQIISELLEEFSREEMKCKVKYDNNCSRLEEMDQQIRMMSKAEDVSRWTSFLSTSDMTNSKWELLVQ